MKLAMASCAKIQDIDPQPAWPLIRAERPDALLLLGDNIYLDRNDHHDPFELTQALDALYERQFAEPGFSALLQDLRGRGAPVMAIYDDHDFLGDNRYGADGPQALRDAARDAFIRAFRPTQTDDEVYRIERIGPLDLIVVDARYHRRSLAGSRDDPDAILGAPQWAWLERQVAKSDAPYLAVASSSTFHAFGDESWELCRPAFDRMVKLLRDRPGALVLSGDAHRNAVYDDSGVIEIVSSAVARRSLVFKVLRSNYGILSFDDDGLRVQLHSLKVSSRFDFRIERSHWTLP